MRFLANENIPLGSVIYLRKAGYDITAVIEEMSGAKDEEVLEYATEKNSIILTFDRDYGELIYERKLLVPVGWLG